VRAAAHHGELVAIKEQIAGDAGPLTEYGRLTLEWGLRFTDMQREWADWAVSELSARFGTVS
jgi:hypothetical protein